MNERSIHELERENPVVPFLVMSLFPIKLPVMSLYLSSTTHVCHAVSVVFTITILF